MQRVMLLNPKGGSGKTTIATSLASYYASLQYPTVLVDHDAQGSSTRWLNARSPALSPIHGIAAFESPAATTKSWHMRIPVGTERVVVDTPAGVRVSGLADLIRRAHRIIIPVLPSHIDIDAVSRFIDELRMLSCIRSGETEVVVVANRVRTRTLVFKELEAFLFRVSFPFITRFRDSQNYVRVSERGLGVNDLPRKQNRTDRMQWAPLLSWLEGEPVPEMVPQDKRGNLRRESYPLPL